MMKKLRFLFELRNRVAHFKNGDTVWDTSAEGISDPENWTKAPDPELMEHLAGQKVLGYASDIDRLLGWFDKVFGIQRRKLSARTLKSRAF